MYRMYRLRHIFVAAAPTKKIPSRSPTLCASSTTDESVNAHNTTQHLCNAMQAAAAAVAAAVCTYVSDKNHFDDNAIRQANVIVLHKKKTKRTVQEKNTKGDEHTH